MPTPTDSSPERQHYLDWLRIIAFGLLVLYHVGMYYVSWDWHIKSPHVLTALEPWMRLVSPWRMDLLFLVSGAVTSIMLRRRSADARWLRERAARLLWPLLFGMLVIVPPQSYLEVVHRYGYAGGYLEFMGRYLSHDTSFCNANGHCLILPTWNHLWYLPYLFVYTLLLWAVLRRVPLLLDRLAGALTPALGAAGLIVWPIMLLALTRVALRARFPVTHALVDDWFSHVQFLPMFVFGAAYARAPSLAERMEALRWKALAWALAAGVVMLVVLPPASRASGASAAAHACVYSALQWCAIVAALGFARRHLNFDASARRHLTDAVFTIYILHQTITIVLAHTLLPWALAPALEAPLLVVGTFAFSMLGYECVRRVAWLRPVFGLRRVHGAAKGERALDVGTARAERQVTSI
jgi:glucans biosynthesis protein C